MPTAVANNEQMNATFRFGETDYSVGHEERALFSLPAKKRTVEKKLTLHNARNAPELVAGPDGLDAQGFAYIKHTSALTTPEAMCTLENIQKTYIPEVEALVCKLTGAKRTVVNNVAYRRKHAKDQEDHTFYYKRGDELDVMIGSLPRDQAIILGYNQQESIEPLRLAHIDYTLKGLQDSARYCRADIKEAAQGALDAEDAHAKDVPRYAAFSVWRPLKTIHRDPLSVCDWRTVNAATDLEQITYRAPSGVHADGEYVMEAHSVRPPTEKSEATQKWYWMPDQTIDDLLLIKFADTQSAVDPSVAGGCPHAAVLLDDANDVSAEPRESIEARVLAFW